MELRTIILQYNERAVFMIATYELFVVCRRAIPLGEPPAGMGFLVLPWQDYAPLRAVLPFSEAPMSIVQIRRDSQDELLLFGLARACADAAAGLALSIMPVTSPPRFQIVHDGREGRAATWAEILSQARAHASAALREIELERSRRAAAAAAWTADPRADFSDLGDIFKK